MRGFYKEIRAADCHPDSKQQCESSHPRRQVAHVMRGERGMLPREFSHGGSFVFLFCFLTVEPQDCFLIIRLRRASWHLGCCTSSPPDTHLSSLDLSLEPHMQRTSHFSHSIRASNTPRCVINRSRPNVQQVRYVGYLLRITSHVFGSC